MARRRWRRHLAGSRALRLPGCARHRVRRQLVRVNFNPGLHVSTVLLTMYDGRTRLASDVADDVRAHFGASVLKTIIPRSVRVSEAPSYGQSVITYDPASSGAVAYAEAARELAFRSVSALDR